MWAAWARRTVQRALPPLGCALALIGLTAWGCSLDKNGADEPLTSGSGGGGGDGGAGGSSACGNGMLDMNEECDDGNAKANDGCDDACLVECDFPEELEGTAFQDTTTNHCYLYVHDTITPQDAGRPWYDALYLCRAHGFELAALTTLDEQTRINDFIDDDDVWIGADDLAQEDMHVWTNGEPWVPDFWDSGEPSDDNDEQSCVEFEGPDKLHDYYCSDVRNYVCERHPPGPCGDGVIDAAEECDDGNDDNDDGCSGCKVDCETLPYDGLKVKDPSSHHCYLYDDNSMTWEQAMTACESTPGFHFATMSSLGELAFITGTPDVINAWIGATDQGNEDTWRWSSGESWEFTPWLGGDPMNGDSEDCLRFLFDSLTAADCGEQHPYLCEREPVGKRSPDAP